MSGQILKLTGMVDQRTLEKYERESKEKNRESWALSWLVMTYFWYNITKFCYVMTNSCYNITKCVT